jgi:hypothetical protein
LPRLANDLSGLPGRQATATRRGLLGGAMALAANPIAMSACDGAISDPIIPLIAEEERWRLLAVAARATAESFLFALPKAEWPAEFDDHPIMAEALSLETRAHELYARILETPATTLAGLLAKLEPGEGDAEITAAVVADLRRWLQIRS